MVAHGGDNLMGWRLICSCLCFVVCSEMPPRRRGWGRGAHDAQQGEATSAVREGGNRGGYA